jgi:hypothetical protein
MPSIQTSTIEFVRIPSGTEVVLGVFVNGVEQHEGKGFALSDDRIRFLTPLQEFRPVTGVRRALNAVGIGVYDRGDTIDLRIQRGGQTEVVRADASTAKR